MKTFNEKLIDIQQRYEAPKSENNDFGGYKYRNVEVMLKALKPLLKEHNLRIMFNDQVINLAERYYISSTCIITDGKESESVSAQAREEHERKKSDASQLTGSASTYARKYALSGLLGVDDGVNDPDSKDNDRGHYVAKVDNYPASDRQRSFIAQLLTKNGISTLGMLAFLEDEYGIIPGTELGTTDAKMIIEDLLSRKGQ